MKEIGKNWMKKWIKYLKRLFCSLLFLFWTRTYREPRSKGEREVIEYLTKRNIKFKREKRIKCNTDFQRNVYIDFYLPDSNTFIEYNGKQHYVPVEIFGGKPAFERQQKRDKWVREYCKKNNIRLIEIPYYAHVETYLNFYLFTNLL